MALFFSLSLDDALVRIGEDPQQLEVEDDVWSKFGEGWRRKGGEKVAEKWWRIAAVADGRPVDELTVGKLKRGKKREKGRGK